MESRFLTFPHHVTLNASQFTKTQEHSSLTVAKQRNKRITESNSNNNKDCAISPPKDLIPCYLLGMFCETVKFPHLETFYFISILFSGLVAILNIQMLRIQVGKVKDSY